MKLTKRLVVSDIHFPYHDKKAWKIFLDIAANFKPDEIILNGDIFDCYLASQYDKDPLRNFKLLEQELIPGRDELANLEQVTKCKKFIFMEGNHENCIERYVSTYASVLAGSLSTREILGLPKYYQYFPYGQKGHYKVGNFVVTHGTLCGKHVAAAMVSKYGTNVIFGHVHRIQEYVTANYHGEQIRAVSYGWLGDKTRAAEYIKNVADWSHGFALMYTKPDGKCFVQVIHIENYEAVFNGEIYPGKKTVGFAHGITGIS